MAYALKRKIGLKTNAYNRASKKKGPPRCWFSKQANLYGLACYSEMWAQNMASHVLRKGAAAWGTKELVNVNPFFIRIGKGAHHVLGSKLLSDPGWYAKHGEK